MQEKVPEKKSSQGLENFGIAVGKGIWGFFKVVFFGACRAPRLSAEFWLTTLLVVGLIAVSTFSDLWHIQTLYKIAPKLLPIKMWVWMYKLGPTFHFYATEAAFILLLLFCLGIRDYAKRSRLQKSLDEIGLKTASGKLPQIKDVRELEDHKSLLVIHSKAIGIEKYHAKKNDLISAFGKSIESIELGKNKRFVEIVLTEKEIPTLVRFEDMQRLIKKPYCFAVGESFSGPIIQDLRSLPHLLVAGASGGGKSNFFRQAFLGLIKNSPHTQVYLLDLKRGIEVAEFRDLPNVVIAKNEKESNQILANLVSEMERRFEYLESKNLKLIEPTRDKMDLIIVGVDEASELYGKSSGDAEKKEIVVLARRLTDKLAKLGRAAGLHLILATQKPVKESIDTSVLENLQGRMAFRMSSTAGSNVALGSNLAKKLPTTKGRGIWHIGSKYTEVQTPMITDEFVEKEIKAIKKEFDDKKRVNLQPMLGKKSVVAIENIQVVENFIEDTV